MSLSRFVSLCFHAVSSMTIAILLCDHVIGTCQIFVYALHLYMAMLSVTCLLLRTNLIVFDQEKVSTSLSFHFICVCFTNMLLFGAFICASGNTEDHMGFSKLELVAVLTAVSWAVHISHATGVALLLCTYPDTTVLPQGTYRRPLLEDFAFEC